ncbi:hypothetical protein TrVE_jg2347 [Triparma verrucosa]|uniref:Uncharacterized protein n=1 Tax=Triparma verrucosa TaxID=1606542 RepID=A0A9W7FEJ1_9STRA|nr:hypothetical protein TrVE_jg2347 [Triparma verrucosa]
MRKSEELKCRYWNCEGKEKEGIETRQYDYKRGGRNEVFGRKDGKERKSILCEGLEGSEGGRGRGMSDGDFESMLSGEFEEYEELVEECKKLAKEDDVIRDGRETIGCECKKIKTRGMREKRLKEELKRRNVDTKGMKKEEMLETLKGILDEEPCCSVGCECEELGVECHFDVCGCEREECGNKEGKYIYDKDIVRENRLKWITTCPEVIE